MTKSMIALLLGAAILPSGPALAQEASIRPVTGTRLDVTASGKVSRVPDLAIITAGVMTRSASASGAIGDNARRMERVRNALRRAGIADRDIQTSSINLNPDYRYQDGQPPVLTGYQASNNVSIRFRDIRKSGEILDALVAEGANQLNGPSLTIDRPEPALDEARVKALAAGRARADLYARSLGMRVVRLLSVSEPGGFVRPMSYASAEAITVTGSRTKTDIEPGSQEIEASVAMSFELQ